jgi:hypothetical protein
MIQSALPAHPVLRYALIALQDMLFSVMLLAEQYVEIEYWLVYNNVMMKIQLTEMDAMLIVPSEIITAVQLQHPT